MIKETNWLRLNIQYFADDEQTPDDPPAEAQSDATETETSPAETPKYTQADIDRIVGERLAREKQKAEAERKRIEEEAERKRQEEAQEYKALYEQEKAAREQAEAQREAERIETLKQRLVADAGYTGGIAARVSKMIGAADEEAIKAELDDIKKDIPPVTYADPATGIGGTRQQPTHKTGDDIASEMYEKIKNRIRR